MKIVADENIPYVKELFCPLGEVVLKAGRHLTSADIKEAEVLLVRSVTPVNARLLAGTKIRFVGTCTIGVDHVDTCYLDDCQVGYASAPGCNANAVVQYVVSALAHLNLLKADKSVVVVGGGNVGSRVYKMLELLGFSCCCYDPFLDKNCGLKLCDFTAAYDADIVSMHTPLTKGGDYPTWRMFGGDELERLKSDVLLLNAGRGGVIDQNALHRVLASKRDMRAVLDVWENEPEIDKTLLEKVLIGTPHIAGYSFEGRMGGALMIFDAVCDYFHIDKSKADRVRSEVMRHAFGRRNDLYFTGVRDAILHCYDIAADHDSLIDTRARLPQAFDLLRKNYPKRREFSHYRCKNVPPASRGTMQSLGFVIGD